MRGRGALLIRIIIEFMRPQLDLPDRTPRARAPYKILLVNQTWLSNELRESGHEVYSAARLPIGADLTLDTLAITLDELLAKLPFSPNRIVYYDDSRFPWITGLMFTNIPTLFVSIDAHQHWTWQAPYSAVFDYVLLAQRDYLPRFAKFQSRLAWFPPWATCVGAPEAARTRSVVFRGTISPELNPARIEFFERLRALVEVDAAPGDYLAPYSEAKIVVNHCVRGDLNFRVFEALACGALLITPRTDNGLPELLTDGADIVTYEDNNPQDAARKIRYYLKHEEERQQIARSGYEKVLSRHTSSIRARQLLEHLEVLEKNTRSKRFIGAAWGCLVAALEYRNASGVLVPKLLENAAEGLRRSLAADEWIDDETSRCVILCKTLLEETSRWELSYDLLLYARQRRPKEVLYLLGLLDNLLTRNLIAEATEVASQVSSSPQALLAETKPAMEQTRRAISAWMRS